MGRRVLSCTAILIALTTLTLCTGVARAAAPRPLGYSDFYGWNDAGLGNASVAGQSFSSSLQFTSNNTQVMLNAHLFQGYNAIAFDLGAGDDTAAGTTGSIDLFGDGQLLQSLTVTAGVPVHHVAVSFGRHTIIKIMRRSSTNTGTYVLANPELVTLGAPPPPPSSIVLASLSLQQGAQQTVDVNTRPGKVVTVLIVYGNEHHLVLGPQKAGPTGHYITSFTVPSGTRGTAQVVAVISDVGVVQATFAVM